ncbi:hypothetical protein C0Q70_18558 [Pomacea canaliculata]|uniref:Mitochondrial calcium uniporter regulator 1 n=1 Tax=Pomacea canaliculata TaxID=400727 RepID=A0A2T7NGV2_POMCA|nr:hypothetical protein C0Q70_18558 [Pomacea canaliculata]
MASSRCVCHCRKLIHLNRHSARVFSVSHRSDIKPDTQEENILTKPIDSGVSKPLDPTEKLHQDFITKTRETKDDIVSSSPSPAPYPEIGKSLTVDARRVDPTTVKQVYYFDSLSYVKALESKGFSRIQAEGMAETLTDIINTTLDHQSRHMVTKFQQEVTVQQLMSEIVSVKKDMVLLQKSEFSQLRSETEKMAIDVSNLKNSLKDEVSKLKGHVTLDINLERGRALEAHAANEKKLQQLHNKIETEIANLKTVFEQYRNDVLKYAGGKEKCMGVYG